MSVEIVDRREHIGGFRNKTMYDYKPDITGVIREHVFMKCAPSTIGYASSNGHITPLFEDFDMTFDVRFTTELLQDYALKFVQDMLDIFGDDLSQMYFRHEDATRPFEWWLQEGTLFDRSIFLTLEFEDDLGLGKKLNALDFWNQEIERTQYPANVKDNYIPYEKERLVYIDKPRDDSTLAWDTYIAKGIVSKGLLKKMFYWFTVDPEFMKKRIKSYLERRV